MRASADRNTGSSRRRLNAAAAISFRSMLRDARERVLSDSEGFDAAIVAIEALGAFLTDDPKKTSLSAFRTALADLARCSSLVQDDQELMGTLGALTRARNDLMHEGAAARRTARQAVEVCLVLEDAAVVEGGLMLVDHFMVESPICAEPWQTMKLVRRTMLARQYSFLPVRMSKAEGWRLLADFELVRVLPRTETARKKWLNRTLREVVDEEPKLELLPAHVVELGTPTSDLTFDDRVPVLIVASGSHDLRGIITAFDLL